MGTKVTKLREFGYFSIIVGYCFQLFFHPLPVTNRKIHREFPSGAVVRTLCSHCQGPGFNPWSRNLDLTSPAAAKKKKKKKERKIDRKQANRTKYKKE